MNEGLLINGTTKDQLPLPNVDGSPVRKMVEVYSSVKGEGTQAGMPMTFVRFAGCNLACEWCDTPYKRVSFTVTDDILFEMIMTHRPAWVVFTGGEPLMQLSVELIKNLKSSGVQMALESNGQMWNDALLGLDYVCFSPKRFAKLNTPTKHLLHPEIVRHAVEGKLKINELRYVVEGIEDYPVLVDVPSDFITFSPLMGNEVASKDPNWKSGDGYDGRFGQMDAGSYNRCLELVKEHRHRGGRLSVQLHKFIGVR